MATPNQVIIAVPQPLLDTDWIQKHTSKGAIWVLSIVQLICACVAAILEICNILGFGYGYKPDDYFTIGTGIWTGLIFGANGVIGLIVAKEPSMCNLIALLVMSIVSVIFSLLSILLVGVGIGFGYFHSFIGMIHFIIDLVEAGNAIVTAVLSCQVICCGTQEYPGTVQNVGILPQQFTTIPPNQFINSQQFMAKERG